jgi:hypothetical protein
MSRFRGGDEETSGCEPRIISSRGMFVLLEGPQLYGADDKYNPRPLLRQLYSGADARFCGLPYQTEPVPRQLTGG